METIKKKNQFLIFKKDQRRQKFMSITSPILKSMNFYGVVLIFLLYFNDYEGASQSFLLTNFFLFIIVTIMFFISISYFLKVL